MNCHCDVCDVDVSKCKDWIGEKNIAMMETSKPCLEDLLTLDYNIKIVHWYRAISEFGNDLMLFTFPVLAQWHIWMNRFFEFCGLFRSTSHRSNTDVRALLFETNWKCCKAAWNNSQQRCGVGWLGDWLQKHPVICKHDFKRFCLKHVGLELEWQTNLMNISQSTFLALPTQTCSCRVLPGVERKRSTETRSALWMIRRLPRLNRKRVPTYDAILGGSWSNASRLFKLPLHSSFFKIWYRDLIGYIDFNTCWHVSMDAWSNPASFSD